mgnify:FL=1
MEKLTWFKLMWKNGYIQLFIVALAFLIGEISQYDSFYSLTGFYVGISIPILMMLMIAYFGFYKFWKYYKNS